MKRCNYSIDTIVPYELNIYSAIILESLETLPQTNDVLTLKTVLSKAYKLDQSLVPESSLLREFIGGSSLKY